MPFVCARPDVRVVRFVPRVADRLDPSRDAGSFLPVSDGRRSVRPLVSATMLMIVVPGAFVRGMR
jgi:hypothetical protein